MTLLPIVERELRLAARKWASFWIRVAAALVAVFIGLLFMLFTLMGDVSPSQIGRQLFNLLTWMAFPVAALAGVFFTSDCISEERREGTLGLLFLTDLRGHDVVLGKLVTSSMRAVHALLATFPIVALAMIMGGVTGAQFGQTMLALLLTLTLSLTTGLAFSSVTPDGRRAMGCTLFFMLTVCAVAPIADAAWASLEDRPFSPFFSWLSPGYLLSQAERPRLVFWNVAGISAGLALAFLALACWVTPRTWQEGGRRKTSGEKGLLYSVRYGSAKLRERRRRALLSRNPITWLCGRLRWRGTVVGFTIVAAMITVGWLLSDAQDRTAGTITAYGAAFVLSWILYFWMASESARFFAEARRSGALELLLSTPLSGRAVVGGLWQALGRLFLVPMALLAILQAIGALSALVVNHGPRGPEWTFTLVGVPYAGIGGGLFNILTRGVDLIAIGWVGIWMGLTSKNANFAVLKTMLFVQVLPWLVCLMMAPFVSLFTMALFGLGQAPPLWSLTAACLVAEFIYWGKDFIFIYWASSRLKTDLRILALPASQQAWTPPLRVPPPLPARGA